MAAPQSMSATRSASALAAVRCRLARVAAPTPAAVVVGLVRLPALLARRAVAARRVAPAAVPPAGRPARAQEEWSLARRKLPGAAGADGAGEDGRVSRGVLGTRMKAGSTRRLSASSTPALPVAYR